MELIKISDKGLVSAKELYLGLGLNEKNWSRWYPTNIVNNEFFHAGHDFVGVQHDVEGFRHDEENIKGGRPTQDFAISIEFAKHIAMMARTEKSHQYRNYFIECEKRVKENTLNTSELSPELQMFNKMFQALANNELEQKKLKEEIQGIREVVALNSTDWKMDSKNLIVKIAKKLGGNQFIQDVYKEIYTNLERRAACQLTIRKTNKQKKMALEGVCKSKISAVSNLDIIGEEKKLLECFLAIVKELAIKYGV